MARIVWTQSALQHLRSIAEYLDENAPSKTAEQVGDLVESVDQLRDYPNSGRYVPELEDEQFREILVGVYRVIYHLVGTEISILAILHGRRDFERFWSPDESD